LQVLRAGSVILSVHEESLTSSHRHAQLVEAPFRGVLPATETLCLIFILQYWFKIDLVIKIICILLKHLISGRRGRDRDRIQTVTITTKVVSSNLAPPIKLTAMI